ncbi:hypothetical protein ACFSX5_01055 [Devosia albogilva]|uniref:Uncharacterized protein n=1 Tax=Devosia albogilva TaxID=429726 RepID=A0ABW5QFR3_9HYPH
MQVNVYVSELHQDGQPTQMLVLPFGPDAAIPAHLQNMQWRYFATTEVDDRIIGLTRGEVEVALHRDGYLIVTPKMAQPTSQ